MRMIFDMYDIQDIDNLMEQPKCKYHDQANMTNKVETCWRQLQLLNAEIVNFSDCQVLACCQENVDLV